MSWPFRLPSRRRGWRSGVEVRDDAASGSVAHHKLPLCVAADAAAGEDQAEEKETGEPFH